MVDRSAVGLGSVFMHLKAEVNWHRLFHDLIDDFDEMAVKKRRRGPESRQRTGGGVGTGLAPSISPARNHSTPKNRSM